MRNEVLAPCRFLQWDSDFFGFRIASLLRNHLTPEILVEAFDWCERERIGCLYFLAAANSPQTTVLAELNGFRFVDVRLTLEHRLKTEPNPGGQVRHCRESDIPVLRAIAAVSHRDSRFYYDPDFPDEQCDALYETWIERSFAGYADAVLVAEGDSGPAGYISCHVSEDGTGSIGLFAVAEHARGHGVGRGLVNAALAHFRGRGVSRVMVVTQGRNCAAQRLYQSCGFQTCSLQIWYHRWFASASNQHEFVSHSVQQTVPDRQ